MFVGKRATGRHRYTTDAETETLITGLARQMPDMAIAALLNRLGRRTGKGNSWKESNVRSLSVTALMEPPMSRVNGATHGC